MVAVCAAVLRVVEEVRALQQAVDALTVAITVHHLHQHTHTTRSQQAE